jgi:acyl-CoA thioesterase I
MKLYGAWLVIALLLAGCSSEDKPATPPSAAIRPDAPPDVPVMGPERRILAFGDSLFAGPGLNPGETYPAKLEAALRARGINARIANAGVSGDTTASGLQRLAFTLDSQQPPPELVVISLGGNDMLRGLPPAETRKNLSAILEELRRRKIEVVLMGMLSPPNLGQDFRRSFDPIYPALARKHGAELVPFFLQPVIGKPHLILPDRIHPNALGVEELVAATSGAVAKALPR